MKLWIAVLFIMIHGACCASLPEAPQLPINYSIKLSQLKQWEAQAPGADAQALTARSQLIEAWADKGLHYQAAIRRHVSWLKERAEKDWKAAGLLLVHDLGDQKLSAEQENTCFEILVGQVAQNPIAQLLMAEHLSLKGVPRTERLPYYWDAAIRGYVPAMSKLGNRLLADPATHAQGLRFLTAAALQGFVLAQAILAELFDQGELVPQNKHVAVMYYMQVSFQGSTFFNRRIAALQKELCGGNRWYFGPLRKPLLRRSASS